MCLLQIVIRHTEAYNLDRETEVKELLEPLTRLTAKKDFQESLSVASVGFFGAGVFMCNPIFLCLGLSFGLALAANKTSGCLDFEKAP